RKAHLLEDKQIPSVGVFDESDILRYFIVMNVSPSSVNIKQHYGTTVEYQKASFASLDMSALDKLHFQPENLLRRFTHESNPDDVAMQGGGCCGGFMYNGGQQTTLVAKEVMELLSRLLGDIRMRSWRFLDGFLV
ncbi:hypothetical protein Tco_0439419, partial [Tanacetum coccineum]